MLCRMHHSHLSFQHANQHSHCESDLCWSMRYATCIFCWQTTHFHFLCGGCYSGMWGHWHQYHCVKVCKKMLASHEKTNFNANCTKTFQLLHTLLHTLLHQLRRQLIHIQASCMRFVYCSSEDGPLCSTTKARNARQEKGALQQTAVIKEAHLSYTWHVLKHLFSGCYLDIIRLNCRYKYTQHCHFGDTQLNPVKLQVTNNIKPLGRINTTSAPARVSPYLYFSVRRL